MYSYFGTLRSPLSPAMDTPRVGLRISKKQSGQVVVVDVIPGTPAQVSGQVHAGDVVEQADGLSRVKSPCCRMNHSKVHTHIRSTQVNI